jgi:transmembrane protein EpsG
MIGAFLFNFFATLFAKLNSFNYHKNGLRYSIFIIFIFLSIRYNFGNDYNSYLNLFYNINKSPDFSLTDFQVKGNEFGWIYINHLFEPYGFFAMLIFLAGFSCFVLYRFIKKYVEPKYYWWAIFIYTFQPYHMIVLSSAMRQAVAVSFFLISIDFLIAKKPFHYIGIVLLGTLFHSTAYFLLPLVLLSYFNFQIKKKNIILILTIFIGLFFFLGDFFIQAQIFISNYFENEYTAYMEFEEQESKIGLGFILNFIINIITLYYLKHQKSTWKTIISNIIVISFLLIPLSFSIPIITRLNFYLTPLLIVVYPIVFENIKEKNNRYIFMLLISIFTIYQFIYFFYSETWTKHFFEYKTIFSSPTFF